MPRFEVTTKSAITRVLVIEAEGEVEAAEQVYLRAQYRPAEELLQVEVKPLQEAPQARRAGKVSYR